jgi:hypothetical protein
MDGWTDRIAGQYARCMRATEENEKQSDRPDAARPQRNATQATQGRHTAPAFLSSCNSDTYTNKQTYRSPCRLLLENYSTLPPTPVQWHPRLRGHRLTTTPCCVTTGELRYATDMAIPRRRDFESNESNQESSSSAFHSPLSSWSPISYYSCTPLWHSMLAISAIMYTGTYTARVCKCCSCVNGLDYDCIPVENVRRSCSLLLLLLFCFVLFHYRL